MIAKYRGIFTPLQVNAMTLKNRIAMSPMGTNFARSNGEMSDEHIEYYRLRAAGGVGLIIVENVCVDSPYGDNGTTQLRLHHDSFIPQLYKFNEIMHSYDCCTSVQLNHGGCKSKANRNGVATVAPSAIKSVDGSFAHELTVDEILQIAKKYGQAARRAKIAGFDSVEIHAGHGYLINQFLSNQWNHRTDEFGGSLENRARFCRMVIDEVRIAVGNNFPVLMRVSLDEMVAGGNTVEESLEQLKYITSGIDLVETSIGGKYTMDAPEHPDGWRSFLGRRFKDKYDLPCAVMGNIREPQAAEDILDRGDADLIVIGRGLIADPQWVKKVQSGHEESVRPCISCNIGCVGHRIESNTPIRCAVNPSVCSEEWHKLNKVTKDCNVLVIGGGMSGLETACSAAETGCRVTLLEEADELGGWVRKISRLPLKFRMKRLLDYMLLRAESLPNLTCLTGVQITNDLIDSYKPDVVVWCVGSEPLLPPIPGLREVVADPANNVYDVKGFLDKFPCGEEIIRGKEIAIAGGGWVALDVAEYFASSGNHITIIEMQNDVGIEMDRYNRQHASDWMAENKATVLTGHKVLSASDDQFIVCCGEEQKTISFDYGFVCLGLKAKPENNAVKEYLLEKDIPVIAVGDSKRARRIYEGVHEGRDIVQKLRVMGFYD